MAKDNIFIQISIRTEFRSEQNFQAEAIYASQDTREQEEMCRSIILVSCINCQHFSSANWQVPPLSIQRQTAVEVVPRPELPTQKSPAQRKELSNILICLNKSGNPERFK